MPPSCPRTCRRASSRSCCWRGWRIGGRPAAGGARTSCGPASRRRTRRAWSLESLQELLRGFFRRHELKAAITDEQRLLMYRTMALTRAVDDFLKHAFDKKTIRWGEYPSPQKGFRSTGQEAIVGAALPLRRPPQASPGPDYDGDVIAPLIRDLGATLMFRPDPLHPILVQYGKKGTPVDGRDLHVGDLDWGVLPPAAPLAIATQTLAGLAYAWKLRGEAPRRRCVVHRRRRHAASASGTRRSTSRRCRSCRWCSSSRTISGRSARMSASRPRRDGSRCAPRATACRARRCSATTPTRSRPAWRGPPSGRAPVAGPPCSSW